MKYPTWMAATVGLGPDSKKVQKASLILGSKPPSLLVCGP